METLFKTNSTTNQARIATALVLTGILSLSSILTLQKDAVAAPVNVLPERVSQVITGNRVRTNRLPRSVANAVIKDLSKRQGIPARQLQVIDYSQKTWTNGCLELARSGELCTQALVPGWRVVVSNNNKEFWVYHTNSNGRVLRLASTTNSPNNPSAKLPSEVRNAVLQAASRRLNLSSSQLIIVQAQSQTWGNGCLELVKPNESCTQALVPGWRVVVSGVDQSLVYHTNSSGSLVKLNERLSDISDDNLRPQVRDAILRETSQITGVETSEIRIAKVKPIVTDGCLSLPRSGENCPEIALNVLEVTVEAEKQRLVFHAKPDGSEIRLNVVASRINLPKAVSDGVLEQAREVSGLPKRALSIVTFKRMTSGVNTSGWEVTVGAGENLWVFLANEDGSRIRLISQDNSNNGNLPKLVVNAIVRDASKWSGLSQNQLRIVKVEPKTWGNPCEVGFNSICNKMYQPTPGWIVTVDSGSQLWVYHVNQDASIVALDRTPSLQEEAARAIIRDARKLTSRQVLRIIEAQRLDDWNGSCEGIPRCTRPVALGWKATVSDGRESWVYRVKEDGSEFDLEATANSPKNSGIVVPSSTTESPVSLDRDVVFRQISSGGLMGKTFVTVLMKDGRLMQYREGDANDSSRRVWQISRPEYEDFLRLLKRAGFDRNQNFSYQASNGSADYITYTLTSGNTILQYNDISQNNLPDDLQAVVQAWQRIMNPR
jgi:hypothetical protein